MSCNSSETIDCLSAGANISEMFFSVKATGRKDSFCPWLINSLQLPLVLPSSLSLNPPLSLFLTPCILVLPCSASFYHTRLYLSNSQDILLPICVPPSIACCLSPSLDMADSFLSIPLSSSLSMSRQAFLPLALLLSLLRFGILDSHQEGGSYYHSHAKRLTTCHEKIVECQGHKN